MDLVMLRSTTGPYGRLVIEVAYGEKIFSLHQDCMGDDSLGRVVGCRHDASPMLDIPGQHQCGFRILFSGFYNIKCICIMFYIYMYYKRTLVVSDLVLAR